MFLFAVHTLQHLVEGGTGQRADLVCLVHAEPTAEVVWYKNSMRLDLARGYLTSREGRKHHLTIPSVGEEDFANYTCEATNSLGKSRAAIQLRGNPRPPVYKNKVNIAGLTVVVVGSYRGRVPGGVCLQSLLQGELDHHQLPADPPVPGPVEEGRGEAGHSDYKYYFNKIISNFI